jgi:hypothetical protein
MRLAPNRPSWADGLYGTSSRRKASTWSRFNSPPFSQFSLLVTVVVMSAVIPTAIAERWFLPDPERERHEERRHAPFPAEEYV